MKVTSAVLPATTVHPHVRGEHLTGWSMWSAIRGSSPRPWGTSTITRLDKDNSRFIPTSVGNMPGGQNGYTRGPVHPHVRGEHRFEMANAVSAIGSSPRPWGTSNIKRRNDEHIRFIPTSVGNIWMRAVRWSQFPVHPHVRGEHSRWRLFGIRRCGSSPRPWGTSFSMKKKSKEFRFIPTSVGNINAD